MGLSAVLVVASLLCFVGLGGRSLWQDEGETAVLAQSVLRSGLPLARVGVNTVRQTTTAYDENGRWIFHPWGQFYLAAAGLKIAGPTEFGARAPFALCGVLTVGMLWLFVWRYWRSATVATLAAGLLASSATFVLHARQCRYYSLSALTCLLLVFSLVELFRRPRLSRAGGVALALAAQFYVDFGTLFATLPGLALSLELPGTTRKRAATAGLGLVGGLVLMLPGLALHRERLLGGDAPLGFARAIVANLGYVDGWLVPLLLLVPAAGVWISRRRRRESTWKENDEVVAVCGLVLLSGVVAFSFAVPDFYIRYLVPLMSLSKVLFALILVSVHSWLRRRTGPWLALGGVAGLTLATAYTNVASIPMELATRHEIYASPGHEIDADRAVGSPYRLRLRAELPSLVRQLRGDFVGPNRIVQNIARDLARPGETVVLNYGELPLMFHRPDLRIRGGLGWDETMKDVTAAPELVIVRFCPFIDVRPYLDQLLGAQAYYRIRFPMPAMVWGEIPEPRFHHYETPEDRLELTVLVRKDLGSRLAGLPRGEALRSRWWSRP